MPVERTYIDTSVLGAYYCPEPLSAVAESALRRSKVPVISVLSEVELHSLIACKRRLKELDARQAIDIIELFDAHVAEGYYQRMALSTEHFIKARQLIASMVSSLRTLDALHLAVALCESLTLMTADQDLAKAARRHKSDVLLVR